MSGLRDPDAEAFMGGSPIVTGGGSYGGYYGAYKSGGAFENIKGMIEQNVRDCGGVMLVSAVVIAILFYMWWSGRTPAEDDTKTEEEKKLETMITRSRDPFRRVDAFSGTTRFSSQPGQPGSGGYGKTAYDSFINSRESPYFPDVTNRVLQMENREKAAIRALGKINQERVRRAAVAEPAGTKALPWGPFWSEWKRTHPMPGDGYEGLRNKDYSSPY